MSYISILGGNRLNGEVRLQGSKNATLPILAAGVLCGGRIRIQNCPDISDVREMLTALSVAGVRSSLKDGVLEMDTTEAIPYFFGPEFSEKTRGGVLLLGAFLGRFCEAGMAYPGGCVIGARPIDLHCRVFRDLQVVIEENDSGVYAKGKPQGGRIVLSYPSVGASENAILAAVCAEGNTRICGAAKEPEVAELCCFLNKAGAKIRGIGTSCLEIEGVPYLHGTEYTMTGDRIVAGTYLAATAMSGGEVVLQNTSGVCMKGILEYLQATGMQITCETDRMVVQSSPEIVPLAKIQTAPFPAFPTDMQSQMVALLSLAQGDSVVCETVFESRFGIVPELRKMGADVHCEGNRIVIHGRKQLRGSEVTATDLRTGAALVLAGLAAEGETKVYGQEYIARGYEDICGTLRSLGARIAGLDSIEKENGDLL